jgi:hypothetical protein
LIVSSNVIIVSPRIALTLRYKYDAAKIIFASRHEILATGCIHALPKASNLFSEVAHRAAFRFVLELALFDFVLEFFAVAVVDGLDLALDRVVLDCFELDPVDEVSLRDPPRPRDDLRRTRIRGASFTGSETLSV